MNLDSSVELSYDNDDMCSCCHPFVVARPGTMDEPSLPARQLFPGGLVRATVRQDENLRSPVLSDGAGFDDQDEGPGATGALLGRTGEGKPSHVGNYVEFMTSTTGLLFLGNCDQHRVDSTGDLVVRITIRSD